MSEKYQDGWLGLLMGVGLIIGGALAVDGGALIGLGVWCAVVLICRQIAR